MQVGPKGGGVVIDVGCGFDLINWGRIEDTLTEIDISNLVSWVDGCLGFICFRKKTLLLGLAGQILTTKYWEGVEVWSTKAARSELVAAILQ